MNYISNIDTICILIDIENYQSSTEEILKYLEEEKQKAKLYSLSNTSYKHVVYINNMSFYLSTTGTTGYAYVLHNNGFQLNVAQFKSSLKNYLPIQIRISSEYLWSYGISNSWSIIYNWIVETFRNIITEKVFRLDLCTHVSGIDLITNYELSYKGDFKNRQVFYSGNNIKSITFGSRKCKNIYCRIYNKSLEIQEMKHKFWFHEIWQNNSMDINNVWNIEFELKSEFLRQFDINTVNDVIIHLQDLWKYCTEKWLIKIDRTNKRVERCNTCKDWLEIQNCYNTFNSIGLIEKQKQIELDATFLVPNIVGNITSYSARKGTITIDEAFSNLYKDTKKYLQNKASTFENEVANKVAFLYDCEVKQNE